MATRLAFATCAALLTFAGCGDPSDVTFDDDVGGGRPVDAGARSDGGRPLGSDAGRDAAADAEAPGPYTVQTESVQAAGKTHSYLLVVPNTPRSARLPVYFAYHGDGGSAEQARSSFHVEDVTGQAAIVVYPSCPANPAWNIEGNVDNEYLAAFDASLARVASERPADTSRVYALGHSSGAFFSNLLACFRSSKVRAIGSMAGGAPYITPETWPNSQLAKCPGQAAVPIFLVHDRGDGVVSWDSSRWASEYWLYANRGAEYGQVGGDANQQSQVFGGACQNLLEAPADAPVVFCSTEGNGHGIWNQFVPTFVQFNAEL